jgi:hypothetical protein
MLTIEDLYIYVYSHSHTELYRDMNINHTQRGHCYLPDKKSENADDGAAMRPN